MERFGFFFITLLVLGSTGKGAWALELQSRDIERDRPIADVHACTGRNISPHLEWESVPPGTKSFVLICDDPDAPTGTWVHWVVFNIPADVRELKRAVPASAVLEDGTKQGLNDFQGIGYGGPCPPPGRVHHYIFTLYALDKALALPAGRAHKREVVAALQSHVLGKASLTGTYKR